VISPFNGIVNEIVVNLAVMSLKQFHTSISLVKIMLNSSLYLCRFFETLIFVQYITYKLQKSINLKLSKTSIFFRNLRPK